MADVVTSSGGADEQQQQQQLQAAKAPQKKFYRSRAHCNPLSHNDSFDYEAMAYLSGSNSTDFPFGVDAVALGELFPDKLTLALEIRAKVTEYVRLRIEALRVERPGQFQNVSTLRTNAMRYLPHYLGKGQLSKMFFCFPDPQFKARLHRRRIVQCVLFSPLCVAGLEVSWSHAAAALAFVPSTPLLAEYAYLLAPGGILYTITDVEELHQWHVAKCSSHPCFERIPDDELSADPCVKAMTEETEEGKKVARGGGNKYVAVFRRKRNEDVAVDNLFW
ncbi:hypothetical protein BBJ28_00002888 [Nothophytophthora sp. Chile5]|nr:hypothetical protein BBJ28_00002888 [Nothophytophthora sp. Chile5]